MPENYVNAEDFSALLRALRRHPDYRGSVVWSREDIDNVADAYGVDPDDLDEAVCMDTWENMATSDGFEYSLHQAAHDLGGVEA